MSYAVTRCYLIIGTVTWLAVVANTMVFVFTHLSEGQRYVDGDQHGAGPPVVFAHSVHLCDHSWQRMGSSGSSIAFCPGSNLFLGSGLFNLNRAKAHDIPTGLGTDIGGGTSLCLLNTMKDAYQVSQLREETISPLQAFYLATLGGARALHLEDKIGSFRAGNEADFLVLNPAATPMLQFRTEKPKHWKSCLAC